MVRQLGQSNRTNSEIYEDTAAPGVSVAPSVLPTAAVGGKLVIGATKWIERQQVELSQVTDFANAISRVSANGEIWIDTNETLGAGPYTVPIGVTLVGHGGVLSAIATTVLTVKGRVNSDVQIFDHVDHGNRGIIDIIQSQQDVRWFGALNTTESFTAADNSNAFHSCFLSGRKVSGNQNGGIVFVPGSAQFDCNLIDFASLLGGTQRAFFGEGQRISNIRLAVGANTGLLDATSGFPNGIIQGISFNGLRASNPTATAPVVLLSAFNFQMRNCHVTGGKVDNLEVTGAQAMTLESIDSENCGGYGFTIKNVGALIMDGCRTDNCDTGGFLFTRDEALPDDRNLHGDVVCTGLYAEGTPQAVKIHGRGGIQIDGITSNGDNTKEVIRFANYTDAGGKVWPATNNVVHIRGLQGDKQKIVFEAGCVDNLVTLPFGEALNVSIVDPNLPGLNKIVVHGGQSSVVRDAPPKGNDKDYANVIQDAAYNTIPASLNQSSLTVTTSFVPSFGVHSAAAHLAAQSASVCFSWVDSAAIAPVNNRLRIEKTIITGPADYWLNMLVWVDYNDYLIMQIQRTSDALLYNWATSTFITDRQEKVIRIEGGKPQWLSVPFNLPSTEHLLIDAMFHGFVANNRVRAQYFACVDQPNAGLIYQNGVGTPLGVGDYFESTTAALPPVAQLPRGTRVFDTTTLTMKTNSGVAWV